MLKDNKGKILILIILIALLVTIVFAFSMAYYRKFFEGEKKYIITANDVTLLLNETSSDITIGNSLPQKDEDGKNNSAYTFSLQNMSSTSYKYNIYLVNEAISDESKRLGDEFVKCYLINDSLTTQKEPTLVSNLSSDESGRILETGVITGPVTYNYELRFWVDYDATLEDAGGKILSYRLNIEASITYQDESGANVPQLTSGMIPVTYDGSNWVKADTTEAWYDYETQMWANAVTVTESTRQTYMDMDAGEPISMDDINTMWVWIPRYEYKYTDLGTSYAGGTATQPGEIKINFISSDTLTPSDSNTYKIPEGFKFGEENISGFWMGKFETSTLESCTPANSSVNTGCDLTTLTPQVKPNVTSWRGARVSTFFQASRLMQSSDDTLTYNADTYGFDVAGASSMDTHMLKNTEWGIVAMLSQSKYGKYGNSNYTGTNKEVYQNKSSSYITGSSNGTPSTDVYSDVQVTYDTPDTGYGASTTGTIYGVYGMSGSSVEYVMANYNKNSVSTAGFCETTDSTSNCIIWPNEKYLDLYTSDDASIGYKFGDGTYETSGWYNDYASFVNSSSGWLQRGGYGSWSTATGAFAFICYGGVSYDGASSRLAIKP